MVEYFCASFDDDDDYRTFLKENTDIVIHFTNVTHEVGQSNMDIEPYDVIHITYTEEKQ